jgi:hypothetical protein
MSVVTGAFANRIEIQTGQKTVTVPGTAEQLGGATPIPDGFSLTIKAKASNTGTIRIGGTQAAAQNAAMAFTLGADQAISLGVKYLSEIWIDATVAAEGVEYISEK